MILGSSPGIVAVRRAVEQVADTTRPFSSSAKPGPEGTRRAADPRAEPAGREAVCGGELRGVRAGARGELSCSATRPGHSPGR